MTDLSAVLGADARCVNIAIDHGLFNEPAFLAGIENLGKTLATVVAAGPDAIQLGPGAARVFRLAYPGHDRPALVLRTDIANVYGSPLPRYLFSRLIDDPLEHAQRLGAAAVVVNLLLLPDAPELHEQCLVNVARLRRLCDVANVPLIVESLVMRANGGGYGVDGDLTKIGALVRQAMELGADVIKADPADEVGRYREVITLAAPVPVLVRGGGKVADHEIMSRTAALIRQGASGVVYGRNVVQHVNPRGVVAALMGLVHSNMTTDNAMELVLGR